MRIARVTRYHINSALAVIAIAGVTACGTSSTSMTPTAPTTGTANPAPAVVSIVINGAPTTPIAAFQLTAMAKLSDGSTLDVTHTAAWNSSNAAVATVADGLVTVVSDGDVDIRATYQTTNGAVHVAVAVPKGRTLTGFVTDAATSQPIADVRVQTIGGASTRTDAHGSFGLSVNDGRVLVEFSRDGYEMVEKDVTVKGDTQLLVAMAPTK